MLQIIQESKRLADEIRKKGNDLFKKEVYYDALWKYEHALLLCRPFRSLNDDVAALYSNIAAVCLKLGNGNRADLLDPSKFPPKAILWYVFTQQHATAAISLNPSPSIACKVTTVYC